ncbi:uncharacterized protein LOC111194187 [Astyanax mexicanus]|uniref:uncharacterized protein LOC111194187 n=1 Tax=Astyanax mexicanus TaxID=7994 RepID=UPI0020CAFADB|nr:uncharacterized protein LOC111194187 [Astyanax mexicanus]
MTSLEEVILIPDSHHQHPTKSKTGQCLVISAVLLGLIAGLFAGGLFGVMIDETTFRIKKLTPLKDVEDNWYSTAILMSTLGLVAVMISSHIAMVVGYGMYRFLINKEGQRAKANVLKHSAPVAFMGITVSGATVGASYSKCMLELGLFETFLLSFGFLFILPTFVNCLALIHSDEHAIYFAGSYVFIIIYGIAFYSLMWSLFLGLAGVFFHFFVLVLVLYAYYYCVHEEFKLKHVMVSTVYPIVLLLFTMLLFVGTGIVTMSAAEKGPVIGFLATHLMEAALGHLVYLQAGGGGGAGAWKACVGAWAAGGATLAIIQNSTVMLNIGARLWGVIGVSGATGVALSSVGELGERYGKVSNQQWGGMLGRAAAIVGAAAGAFLTGGTRDLSYGFFKSVCAVIIPGMPFVEYILNVFYRGLQYPCLKNVRMFHHCIFCSNNYI